MCTVRTDQTGWMLSTKPKIVGFLMQQLKCEIIASFSVQVFCMIASISDRLLLILTLGLSLGASVADYEFLPKSTK